MGEWRRLQDGEHHCSRVESLQMSLQAELELTQQNGKRPGDPRSGQPPGPERRASHRVDDEQKSGHGALSALSKLKMLERKRAQIPPPRDDSK